MSKKIDEGYETPDEDRDIPESLLDINSIVKIQSCIRRYITINRISLYINSIVKIQSYARRYLQRAKITPSINQTKNWRKSQIWYDTGKKNECEKYQRALVETITNKKCSKTSDRINTENYNIINESRPLTRDDGFYWTEDFDGKQDNLYYNFKMVVEPGGAQTRSLREVAHFVIAQLEYNLCHLDNIFYFVNILDGDESYKKYQQFYYILNKKKYKYVKNFIYVGDMFGFIDWYYSLILI